MCEKKSKEITKVSGIHPLGTTSGTKVVGTDRLTVSPLESLHSMVGRTFQKRSSHF